MQRYTDVVLNSNGQPVESAAVLVTPTGTNTSTSTLYGDKLGTSSRANPLTSDSTGRFWFYANNGRYDLVVSGSYVQTTTVADIMLEDVPLTNLAELSTASAARTNLGLGSVATLSTSTFLQRINDLSDIGTAATARANLGLAIGTNVQAYSTNIAMTTSSNSFTAGQAGVVVALASTGQIAPDLALANNFSLALSANTTLAAPTNVRAGMSGAITITQNATAKTLAINSFYKWAGTATGAVSTATGTVDQLNYYVYSTSAAACNMLNGLG